MAVSLSNISIKFKGESQSFNLKQGLGLQALAIKNPTPIQFDCRKSDCGICIVKILKGQENLSAPKPDEAEFLEAMRADKNERLACQCRVMGDVEIEVEY